MLRRDSSRKKKLAASTAKADAVSATRLGVSNVKFSTNLRKEGKFVACANDSGIFPERALTWRAACPISEGESGTSGGVSFAVCRHRYLVRSRMPTANDSRRLRRFN